MDKTMIVGLHLNDFKLLSNITRKIRSKEFTLRHIENLPKKSDQIDVVISEKRLKNCPIPQIQPQNLDIIELRIRHAYYNCGNVLIGIDPGGTCGLAVIGKNRILYRNEFDNINDLVKITESINLEIGVQITKIGMGSPPERQLIVNKLIPFSKSLQVVNEENSGSGSHTSAAIRIALRKESVKALKNYKPKKGEIAWVQKESRRLSKGLVTIDKNIAQEILIGRITMEKAIQKYTEKIKMPQG